MKRHYCSEEKGEIMFESECNWCGEKEDTPMDFARRIRTTARFNPLMGVLNDCADVIEQQAEKINNMEIWEKKYLDTIEKYKLRNQEQIKRIAELEKKINE